MMAGTNEEKYFENGFISGAFHAIVDALLLRTQGYKAVNEAPIPSRREFGILLIILVITSVAQMIGTALYSASLSELSTVQTSLYDAITGLTISAQLYFNYADASVGCVYWGYGV